jgi:Fe-Mn family superoxide dismutase
MIARLVGAKTLRRRAMAFTLPPLPYDLGALSPILSKETLEYHYGKHHKAYVDNLNKLVAGKPEENKSLEELIKTTEGPVFNNAAQIWNHTFYWNCLSPKSGSRTPSGKVKDLIDKQWGSFDKFKEEFTTTCLGVFGSGWGWLSVDNAGKLHIEKGPGADNPMRHGKKPLLTCDVWEHAYYIDYRNERNRYVNSFWDIVNWDFVNKQLG